VAGRSWKQVEVPESQDFAVLETGKGRVAVYRDEWPDPASLAKDLVDLLGPIPYPMLQSMFDALVPAGSRTTGRPTSSRT
jgi:hypothetical protein